MAADSDAATSGVPAPRDPDGDYRILLVCLGNICRSPMAEVILRDEIDQAGLGGKVSVESAGTGDWHVGGPMDDRARTELRRRGYDGSAHVARQITADWLPGYDLSSWTSATWPPSGRWPPRSRAGPRTPTWPAAGSG